MSKQRGIIQRGGSRLAGSAVFWLLASYALAQTPAAAVPAAAVPEAAVPDTAEPAAAAPEAAAPAGTPAQSAPPTLDEKLDALLGETLTADEYRESRHCLHRSAYRRVDIINQEFLLFSKRGTYYLNRLKRKCPGLRRNLLLTFRMTTNSVCRSDLVYASDRIDLHRGINSSGIPNGYRATCHLGEFEQIGEQQALALKAAL